MFRYLAFVWSEEDPTGSARAANLVHQLRSGDDGWHVVSKSAGHIAVAAGERQRSSEVYPLPDGAGVVFGKVFLKRGPTEVARLDTSDQSLTSAIARTCGRYLIDHAWGRYVAVIRNHRAGATYVLRDPGGNLPCFYAVDAGMYAVMSRPEDCLLAGWRCFNVNWRYIAAHVLYRALPTRETGLKEVYEVRPGECVEIGGGKRTIHVYWDPVDVAKTSTVENVDCAESELRQATRMSVHAWASAYDGILHTLSGGIDSSIVLACLSDAPSQPHVTCVNYVTQGPEGDERRFARLAAERVGCGLIEELRDPSTVKLERVLEIVPSARPSNYRYSIEHSAREVAIASAVGATAVFGGGGGDQIYYQSRAVLAVADYVRAHGLSRGLWSAVWDAARVERQSVWRILWTALVSYRGLRGWDPLSEFRKYRSFVSRELLLDGAQTDTAHMPDWFDRSRELPVGKAWHLFLMSIPQTFYDPLGEPDAPERVHPLASQPLIELALRLPTYVLIVGGWDRGLARRAFREALPHAVVARRTKGRIDDHGASVLRANIRFIRELLLDGLLMRERLLDRAALEALFRGDVAHSFNEIQDHVSTEAWLRCWAGPGGGARQARSARAPSDGRHEVECAEARSS